MSSVPIKVSKKDQVFRDYSLRNLYCISDNFTESATIGLLIHHTITGKINQSPSIGHTIKSVSGVKKQRAVAVKNATNGEAHIIL